MIFTIEKTLARNTRRRYTEKDCRCQTGHLLNMVVEDMKSKGITPILFDYGSYRFL